jgi:hypothetical protein
MLIFEKAIVKKYWPADDRGENEQIVRQVVIQAEVNLDNSSQVGELFNNMVRGLVRLSLMDTLTGEEYVLPAVTIKPFNVKQKQSRIGKGEASEIVRTEYAALSIVSRLTENGGQVLADLYRFFNIELQLTIDVIRAGTVRAGDETNVPNSAGE